LIARDLKTFSYDTGENVKKMNDESLKEQSFKWTDIAIEVGVDIVTGVLGGIGG